MEYAPAGCELLFFRDSKLLRTTFCHSLYTLVVAILTMVFRHTKLSRRDALLVLIGASVMHLLSALSQRPALDHSIGEFNDLDLPSVQHITDTKTVTATETQTQINTITRLLEPSPISTVASASHIIERVNVETDLPHTSIIAHAPGWTLFRNLYMSNGTLFILSSNRSFPEIRLMTSTGLAAQNTPESIAAREPTSQNMDFITPEQALKRWGGDPSHGQKNRVWSVEGNTVSIFPSCAALIYICSITFFK